MERASRHVIVGPGAIVPKTRAPTPRRAIPPPPGAVLLLGVRPRRRRSRSSCGPAWVLPVVVSSQTPRPWWKSTGWRRTPRRALPPVAVPGDFRKTSNGWVTYWIETAHIARGDSPSRTATGIPFQVVGRRGSPAVSCPPARLRQARPTRAGAKAVREMAASASSDRADVRRPGASNTGRRAQRSPPSSMWTTRAHGVEAVVRRLVPRAYAAGERGRRRRTSAGHPVLPLRLDAARRLPHLAGPRRRQCSLQSSRQLPLHAAHGLLEAHVLVRRGEVELRVKPSRVLHPRPTPWRMRARRSAEHDTLVRIRLQQASRFLRSRSCACCWKRSSMSDSRRRRTARC